MIVERPSYVSAKCIEQIDSRLMLSNLTSSSEAELQELTNKISTRYKIKEIEYQDTSFTTEEGTSAVSPTLDLLEVYVKIASDPEGNPINTNHLTFRFNKEINIFTPIGAFGLITTLVTGGSFSSSRTSPVSIFVDGKNVIAVFGPSVDFTDEATWNFDDFNLVEDTATDHLPITTWGVGSSLDSVSGGPTADVFDSSLTLSYTGAGTIYDTQTTCSVAEALGIVTVTLPAAGPFVFDVALYGTNHSTSAQGLFGVIDINNATEFTIDSIATGNDPAGTPVMLNPTPDILFKNETVLASPGSFPNEGYFDDFKDEKLATDFKTFTRDENYSLSITYLFKNGGQSSPFHIVGRNRTAREDAIKDISRWVNREYVAGESVSWLGNIYNASSATLIGENPSVAPGKWSYLADAPQEGWCGTYESEELYITDSGLPSRLCNSKYS